MTENSAEDSWPVVSPVWQFLLLIIPVVINGFFSVYALVGWILSGRDKANWVIEADQVALWVGGTTVLYSTLVMVYVQLRGARWPHVLLVSSWSHILLAVLLMLSVFVSVRL